MLQAPTTSSRDVGGRELRPAFVFVTTESGAGWLPHGALPKGDPS